MARNKGKKPSGAARPTSEKREPAADQERLNDAERREGQAGPEAQEARPQAEPAKPGPQAATDRPAVPQSEPAKPGAQEPAAAAPPSAAAGGALAAPAEGSRDGRPSETPSGRGPERASGQGGGAAGGGPPSRGPSATSPPPARGGGARASLWGLVGGVIGGVAVWALMTYVVEPRVGVDVESLRAQVSDLDQRVEQVEAAAPAGDPSAVEELAGRLDQLEQQVAGAEPDEGQVAEFRERLASLETDVAEISAMAAGEAEGEGGAVSAALESRLDQLEEQLAGMQAAEGSGQQTAELQQRVEQLAQQLDEVSEAMPDVGTTLSAAIDELSEQTAGQGERLAGIGDDVDALRSDVEELRSRIISAGGRTDELAGRLDSLTGRLEQTEERLNAAEQTQEKAAALAVLTSQLAAALDQGEPFRDLLEPLRALAEGDGPVGEAVAGLEPVADQGAPTLAALQRDFDAIASEIVHRARAPQGEGLLDQAADNLMRLVTVRPVGGDVEGEGASARVARAEARLAEGDLEGAVSELEQLDGAAAETAEPWLERARTRLAAETALADLQGHTAELLGSSRQEP